MNNNIQLESATDEESVELPPTTPIAEIPSGLSFEEYVSVMAQDLNAVDPETIPDGAEIK